ncbi:helix-turn-helix domain-containing protein [Alkaliphilus transvaalensis]|uniref:helix-turn-helix domain-containing protein n=1 Tax=Alkaliphilus transvaalensis TaxID=114628 RepID=UPI00047CDDF7|nr:helix-turn-helix transcriptional regulator [Alkaliphilus transvaalensis]
MKFSNPGEKVKHLRMAMGLTQEDLVNDCLTLEIVSMIEKNKENLTWKTAGLIADSLNNYYKATGKEITAEYLMEVSEEEARDNIKQDIDKLQRVIDSGHVDESFIYNTFEEVMDTVKMWGFKEELVELQLLRGDYYYYSYQYNEALQDYLDVQEYYMKNEDYSKVARMYIILGTVYQMQMLIDTAIIYFVKAEDIVRTYETNNRQKIIAQSLFNRIICYSQIKRYDLVFSHIELLKSLKWDDPIFKNYYDQALLIEANTYRDLDKYMKAAKIYDVLLLKKFQLDKDTLFLVYENYSVLHRKQGNIDMALEYIQKALEIKEEVNINYRPALYLYQAQCCKLPEEYEKIKKFLENGLTLSEWVSKQHMVIDMHFAFVELYLKMQDVEEVLKHLQEVERLLIEKDFKPRMYDLYSYYIELYTGLGDVTKVLEYTKKIRSKNYLTD